MKSGTPGFCGERLTLAREARGLSTMMALAELLGISRAAVSQFESGESTPSPDTLRNISSTLNLPLHYFLKSVIKTDQSLFFRSLASATNLARKRAMGRLHWLQDIVDFLSSHVTFPPVNCVAFEGPTDPYDLSNAAIEALATATRRHWRLGDGPISNITWLLENNGFIVSRQELDSDELDAFSQWSVDRKRPFIVLGANKSSAARSRFDAGHELGHMILHKNIAPEHFLDRKRFKLIENQAHFFGGCLHMPANTFSNDVNGITLDALLAQKTKWRISVGAMIHRARDLDLINDATAKTLWMNRTRRGWRLKEPLDDRLEVEEPRFLKRCFELLVNKQVMPKSSIPVLIGLNARDVESLCGLGDGFLADNDQESVPEDTDIIRFPRLQSQ